MSNWKIGDLAWVARHSTTESAQFIEGRVDRVDVCNGRQLFSLCDMDGVSIGAYRTQKLFTCKNDAVEAHVLRLKHDRLAAGLKRAAARKAMIEAEIEMHFQADTIRAIDDELRECEAVLNGPVFDGLKVER